MIKKAICCMLIICFTCIVPRQSLIHAKMTIISPQGMINMSDLIVVGVIKERNYTENQAEVSIAVDTVLKGSSLSKEIVLRQTKHAMSNWEAFDFPKKGSNVMVLLTNTKNSYVPTYWNSICTIQHRKLHVFHGMGFGEWMPNQYEEAYQAYYENPK